MHNQVCEVWATPIGLCWTLGGQVIRGKWPLWPLWPLWATTGQYGPLLVADYIPLPSTPASPTYCYFRLKALIFGAPSSEHLNMFHRKCSKISVLQPPPPSTDTNSAY